MALMQEALVQTDLLNGKQEFVTLNNLLILQILSELAVKFMTGKYCSHIVQIFWIYQCRK